MQEVDRKLIPKKNFIIVGLEWEKTGISKKCIQSLEKYCPDYEIIEWNEDNLI